MKHITSVAVVIAAILACQNAKASLVGDEVFSVMEVPFLPGENLWDGNSGLMIGDPIAAIVGAGVEYSVTFAFTFEADLDDSSLVLTIDPNNSNLLTITDDLNYSFTDLDWVGTPGHIVDVVMVQNDFSGVTFGFGPDSINVFIPDQVVNTVSSVSFDIIAQHDNVVPEPSSLLVWSLIGLTLGGFAWRHRRK